MRLTITVCDICKDTGRTARTYTVTVDGESGQTDRCEEHGAILHEIVSGTRPPEPKPEPKRPAQKAGGGRRRSAVVSFDEVERARR